MSEAILFFFLGLLASFTAIIFYEVGKKPWLEINIGSIDDGQKTNLSPYRFLHVSAMNKPVGRPWKYFTDRNIAHSCQAIIEVYNIDNPQQRAIKDIIYARWSGTPELVQTVAIPTPQGAATLYVPDITKLPQGRRMDLLPGYKEGIDVALKFDGDPECYIFSNESYFHPQWKNPKWKLDPGKYRIRVKLFSGSLRKEKHFLLINEGTKRSDLILREVIK